MSIEYFIFIFLSSLALIQAASAWNSLEFLLFIKNRVLTFILGIIIILASYYWFFYFSRGYARDAGGNQQLLLFPLAVLSSLIFTLFFSSLITAGKKRHREKKVEGAMSAEGIETLREMSYWQALHKLSKEE